MGSFSTETNNGKYIVGFLREVEGLTREEFKKKYHIYYDYFETDLYKRVGEGEDDLVSVIPCPYDGESCVEETCDKCWGKVITEFKFKGEE